MAYQNHCIHLWQEKTTSQFHEPLNTIFWYLVRYSKRILKEDFNKSFLIDRYIEPLILKYVDKEPLFMLSKYDYKSMNTYGLIILMKQNDFSNVELKYYIERYFYQVFTQTRNLPLFFQFFDAQQYKHRKPIFWYIIHKLNQYETIFEKDNLKSSSFTEAYYLLFPFMKIVYTVQQEHQDTIYLNILIQQQDHYKNKIIEVFLNHTCIYKDIYMIILDYYQYTEPLLGHMLYM